MSTQTPPSPLKPIDANNELRAVFEQLGQLYKSNQDPIAVQQALLLEQRLLNQLLQQSPLVKNVISTASAVTVDDNNGSIIQRAELAVYALDAFDKFINDRVSDASALAQLNHVREGMKTVYRQYFRRALRDHIIRRWVCPTSFSSGNGSEPARDAILEASGTNKLANLERLVRGANLSYITGNIDPLDALMNMEGFLQRIVDINMSTTPTESAPTVQKLSIAESRTRHLALEINSHRLQFFNDRTENIQYIPNLLLPQLTYLSIIKDPNNCTYHDLVLMWPFFKAYGVYREMMVNRNGTTAMSELDRMQEQVRLLSHCYAAVMNHVTRLCNLVLHMQSLGDQTQQTQAGDDLIGSVWLRWKQRIVRTRPVFRPESVQGVLTKLNQSASTTTPAGGGFSGGVLQRLPLYNTVDEGIDALQPVNSPNKDTITHTIDVYNKDTPLIFDYYRDIVPSINSPDDVRILRHYEWAWPLVAQGKSPDDVVDTLVKSLVGKLQSDQALTDIPPAPGGIHSDNRMLSHVANATYRLHLSTEMLEQAKGDLRPYLNITHADVLNKMLIQELRGLSTEAASNKADITNKLHEQLAPASNTFLDSHATIANPVLEYTERLLLSRNGAVKFSDLSFVQRLHESADSDKTLLATKQADEELRKSVQYAMSSFAPLFVLGTTEQDTNQ